MNHNQLKISATLLAASLCLGLSAPSAAASVPLTKGGEADTLVAMDKVQITAIKQGLSLRREAVAASVLDGRDIRLGGVDAIKDATALAPNFFIPDYGSRMTSSIYVRGLGTRIEQPVVGLNIDNVPIADKNMYDLDLSDIERIEILRGPQSTLYGRNTMCGVINVYTTSPLAYQGVRFNAEYGSRNHYRIASSAYNKFGEGLGLSVAGQFSHTDGYFRNLYDNSLCDKENSGSMRIKFQYRRNALSIDNVAAFSVLRQGGYPYASAESGRIEYNDESSYRRIGATEGLSVKYDWRRMSLSSVTSYQYLDDEMVLDQDFLPLSYFTLTQAKRQHDITEDLVLRSKDGSRYGWLVGAFGFYKSQKMHAPVTFKKDGIDRLILDNINKYSGYDGEYRWGRLDGSEGDELLLDSDFTTHTVGAALYHESSLRAGRWLFKLGIRMDYESSQMHYRNDAEGCYTAFPNDDAKEPTEVPFKIAPNGVLSQNSLEFLPKLAISVDLGRGKRNMLYLSAAKGYKAGGFNTQMFSEILQQQLKRQMGLGIDMGDIRKTVAYKPEKSWNFEAGGHFATADATFVADAALFYILCFDRQLTVFPEGQTTGRMMTNAGRSRSCGAEATLTYRPHRNVSLSAAYGYTNARFTKFVSGNDDYRGKRVPYSPEHTLSARATYTIPLPARWAESVAVSAGYKGAGRIYWNEENSASQPFYSLIDCSVRLESRHWAVELWMKNVSGTKYDVFYFESMGNRFLQRGRPRSFGIKASIDI